MEKTLKEIILKPTQLARDLGVSTQSVRNWIELNAIPPKRITKVANALDIEIRDLLAFATKTSKPAHTIPKTADDLEAILAAYEGRPYETSLPAKSVQSVLDRWGSNFPVMYKVLKLLHTKEITLDQASQRLGITKAAVTKLRQRYGVAPGSKKAAPKNDGPMKVLECKAKSVALDVISGRNSAVGASKVSGIHLRTLHRYIESALRPHTLNEISHWGRNFRMALAWDIEHGKNYVSAWREKAVEGGYLLPKTVKWPGVPADMRKATFEQITLAFLSGQMSIDEIAVRRGGEAKVIGGLIRAQLASRGINMGDLSPHHLACVGEILLAERSHFRSKAKFEGASA